MTSLIHKITRVRLFFLPVRTRVPLKFGPETLTSVTCARVGITLVDRHGRSAEGWGETPLSVQWVWPSDTPYEPRHERLKSFCRELARKWRDFPVKGHPLESGSEFLEAALPHVSSSFNASISNGLPLELQTSNLSPGTSNFELQTSNLPLPHLAALVCNSPFDLALHDAYGHLVGRPVYSTYGRDFLESNLARFLKPVRGSSVSFKGVYPTDFLVHEPPTELKAWHLVGGLDLLEPAELTGSEPHDGHPVVLTDWIKRDGLKCLKVKLRGNDAAWDYERLVRVGEIARRHSVDWLSADFNCTVHDPTYVNGILDRLRDRWPHIYGMILYVEQPFPYDLEHHRIDAHSVAARKPLFLDESAHDWRLIRLGRELGWSGVALKTCKTQTGAILSACWARAHGMSLMVQDLTNPMLAQIPHALLAAHAGTIMGIETNSMQFYPEASSPEAAVHPGLFQRRDGKIQLKSISGPGFGYRLDEIHRSLPNAEIDLGT